jgi:hypothetical protein
MRRSLHHNHFRLLLASPPGAWLLEDLSTETLIELSARFAVTGPILIQESQDETQAAPSAIESGV